LLEPFFPIQLQRVIFMMDTPYLKGVESFFILEGFVD
jgi:hypothetical protein